MFELFCSIIRPHKAASFNTVKRARIVIGCLVSFSTVFNIPHLFITSHQNWQCQPYGSAIGSPMGQVYYWLSFIVNFALPFTLILIMNSVIIHKIRKKSDMLHLERSTGERKNSKVDDKERQIFAILLLVTFVFLILTTPGYVLFLCVMIMNFFSSPQGFAGYYLFYSVAQKLQVTNHAINFLLYVISGRNFRTDLLAIFKFRKGSEEVSVSNLTENSSISNCCNNKTQFEKLYEW